MRIGSLLAATLILCVPSIAQAQSSVTTDPDARMASATQLVTLLKMQAVMDTLFAQITPLVTTSVLAAIEKEPNVPMALKNKLASPTTRPPAQEIMGEEILKAYRERMPQLMQASAREYAEMFSDADLRAAIAFYETPFGQRMIDAQPRLQANMSKRGSELGEEAGKSAIPAAVARILALGNVKP